MVIILKKEKYCNENLISVKLFYLKCDNIKRVLEKLSVQETDDIVWTGNRSPINETSNT